MSSCGEWGGVGGEISKGEFSHQSQITCLSLPVCVSVYACVYVFERCFKAIFPKDTCDTVCDISEITCSEWVSGDMYSVFCQLRSEACCTILAQMTL